MFGMSLFETLLIAVIALIVLGPKKVYHLAVWAGRSVAKARKAYGQWNHLIAQEVVSEKDSLKKNLRTDLEDAQ